MPSAPRASRRTLTLDPGPDGGATSSGMPTDAVRQPGRAGRGQLRRVHRLLLDACAANIRFADRFAHTGPGWALRELSVAEPERVREFVDAHPELSREGRRMALARLHPARIAGADGQRSLRPHSGRAWLRRDGRRCLRQGAGDCQGSAGPDTPGANVRRPASRAAAAWRSS